ncbi:MAG TPA: hypothetical protein OIM59_10530 [Bacteroides mediterraneensis]|uniref:hypothetical protein n=1 Tax=Bacteroides mediterraneensis TaxID=1841856 RepID=UPI0026EC9CD0|nr:hypothetical protein [Bacteroides mediterraneensis]HJH65037.1 hypothetical protein [Bacteroides mediterraneensis]
MVTGCKREAESVPDANRDWQAYVKRRRKEKPEVDGEPDVNGKLRVCLIRTGTER